MRTQVGIVGAGPAGLVLGHLLHLSGIESVILESRSREYCQERVRAGLLEQNTVDLLNETGLGERMRREGLVHHGINLRFEGRTHRIDFAELTGRGITIYAQGEVIKDLVDARLAFGGPLFFEVDNVCLREFDSARPRILFQKQGRARGTGLRFHRRLRRLSRRLPAFDSRRRADGVSEGLSVRLAGNSCRGAAFLRGIDLRVSRSAASLCSACARRS